MATTLTIKDAVDNIHNADTPVLLLDTCVLLNIINAPTMPEGNMRHLEPVRNLINYSRESPTKLTIIAAPCIETEWKNKVDDVKAALAKHLNQTYKNIESIHNSCRLASIPIGPVPDQYTRCKLADLLEKIATTLYDSAIALVEDDTCAVRAAKRHAAGKPPARKGENVNDCSIVEHYIELCQQLHNRGFFKKIVFASSNVSDFCKRNPTTSRNEFHNSLYLDFSGVKFEYVKDLNHASAIIRSTL